MSVLIGLETDRKPSMQHLFPIKSVYLVLLTPLAYSVYTCEHVDNYGWSLSQFTTQTQNNFMSIDLGIYITLVCFTV